jgi:uncharacterized protein
MRRHSRFDIMSDSHREAMEIRFTKWGGHGHWRHPAMQLLGTDAHGVWLGGPAGTVMQRGDEPPVTLDHAFVSLIPATGCWIAHFNAPGRTQTAVYVDVTDRPVLSGGVVHAVDLDLDVVRLRDGTVEVLDEDEFAEHQIRYGYPPQVIAQALATTDNLVKLITARAEPFGEAGPTWLNRLHEHPPVKDSGPVD